MNKAIKKYAAIFLIVLFVFPFIQRDMHDFAHDLDFHCTNKTEKHFHPIEHHCTICDEVFFISDGQDCFYKFNPPFKVFSIVQQFAISEFAGQAIRSRSLRAPPVKEQI